ncbi:hypothetical protein [Streptomyces sp. NPDC002785]|uniref:hypothetical protein n=1 Tax=Streptomyces sp. NPDC002785 TaxID=3154543 RepID=UPI00331C1009
MPFLTGVRPLRGDPVTRLPWRTPLWTGTAQQLPDPRLASSRPPTAFLPRPPTAERTPNAALVSHPADEVRRASRETLTHHIADGGPHARIVDRRHALSDTAL